MKNFFSGAKFFINEIFRFTSAVCQAWISPPNQADLKNIFSSLMRSVDGSEVMVAVTTAMVDVYEQISINFGPEM